MTEEGVAVEISSNGSNQSSRYRDVPHRSSNDALKAHSNFAVKLSETAVEFIQKLAATEEQHSQQLHGVVRSFKKKTAESFKKDPLICGTSYFKAWEALLDESDRQARAHTDISQRLITSVSQQLSELTMRKKNLMKKWYTLRELYMARIDKTENTVEKLFKEYQDQWSRYAEGLEKGEGSAKDMVVLHSYNAHNDYVLGRTSFNCLHEEFYNKQIFDMLDELQAIQEDLVKGFRHCLKNRVEIQQDKLKDTLKYLSNLNETIGGISPSSDVAHFVGGQNIQVKVYPPPKADFRNPELPTPKLPDAEPVHLDPLNDSLQLVDLTQAPLIHIQEDLKKKKVEINSSLDQLHKEYQSVKTLLDSYRENTALGDPNSLVEELLQIRNKVRNTESDLAMTKGKLSTFAQLSKNGVDAENAEIAETYEFLENCTSSPDSQQHPLSALVVGRSHEFVEDERRFRIPVFCTYCDGILQPPISRGVKCKICKVTVHTKCQNCIPYCSGQPPVKSQSKASNNPPKPKGSPKMGKKDHKKRFSWMVQKKNPSLASSESLEDDDDETLGGLYEVPPVPPPKHNDKSNRIASPVHAPQPPRRGESLDPRQSQEETLSHHSFEDTVEEADTYTFCVALFDYDKVNPNDMEIHAGDVVELINTFSSDWWKGTVSDKKGYFPASYVELISPGDVVMKAVYDFTPSSSEEMPLEEGQIVIMKRDDGDGWLLGKAGDSEGLFPENYAERLHEV